MKRKALLLSGGIDSLALAVWKKPKICLTIDYGQVSALGEIRAAKAICRVLNLQHEIITINCSSLGSGDLAGKASSKIAPVSEWWPYRNQLLITLAAMKAITYGTNELMFGSVKTDKTHKDGTKQFYDIANSLLSFQEGKMRVTAPAISMTTIELIKKAKVDLSILIYSHSCHKSEFACGQCRGCYKHQKTMDRLGYGAF